MAWGKMKVNVTRVIGKISLSCWRAVFAIGLISVATLSLLPGNAVSMPAFPHADKLAHFIAYAALGFTGGFSFRTRVLALVIALMAYGALIEYLQSFLPMREMDVLDFIANMGGVFCGAFMATKLLLRAERNG